MYLVYVAFRCSYYHKHTNSLSISLSISPISDLKVRGIGIANNLFFFSFFSIPASDVFAHYFRGSNLCAKPRMSNIFITATRGEDAMPRQRKRKRKKNHDWVSFFVCFKRVHGLTILVGSHTMGLLSLAASVFFPLFVHSFPLYLALKFHNRKLRIKQKMQNNHVQTFRKRASENPKL